MGRNPNSGHRKSLDESLNRSQVLPSLGYTGLGVTRRTQNRTEQAPFPLPFRDRPVSYKKNVLFVVQWEIGFVSPIFQDCL